MSEPVWIDLEVVLAINDEQLAEHGGQSGVRDRGLLESALVWPRNQFSCGEASIAQLASSYAFGISRNHPFLDGNKRTSLVVAQLFLDLNGYGLTATDSQCVTTFLALAAGELTEDQLAACHTVRRPQFEIRLDHCERHLDLADSAMSGILRGPATSSHVCPDSRLPGRSTAR